MAEIYEDVKSPGVYNSGHLLENDFQSKTPWATPGNSQELQSNAKRRRSQKLDMARRKGNGRKRMM